MTLTYAGWHARLRRQRGRADSHKCTCGLQAEQWSLRSEFTRPGARHHVEDLTAYDPLCRTCHMQRDNGGRPRSSETRAKISASRMGQSRDTSAATAAAQLIHIGQPLSAEHRSRISVAITKLRAKA